MGKDTIRLQSQAEGITAKPLRVFPGTADPIADAWWSRIFTSCNERFALRVHNEQIALLSEKPYFFTTTTCFSACSLHKGW